MILTFHMTPLARVSSLERGTIVYRQFKSRKMSKNWEILARRVRSHGPRMPNFLIFLVFSRV